MPDPTTTCPNPRGYFLAPSGERMLRRCGRLRCVHCGPRIALSTASAIVLAQPHSSGVVTLKTPPPDPTPEQLFRTFATALREIAEDIRSDGHAWEHCWITELSRTGAPYVHLVQHGDHVPSSRFSQAADAAGLGWADLQPIRHVGRVARYVLKGALSVLDDAPERPEDVLELHLALNGWKLAHATKRFWRHGDDVLSGVREARRTSYARARRARRARSVPPSAEVVAKRRPADEPR